MTVQETILAKPDAGENHAHIAELYTLLDVIEQIAKTAEPAAIPSESALQKSLAIASRVARNRFDTMAAETAVAATAGARALLGRSDNEAAAAELAAYLRLRIARLGRLLGL